MSNTGTKIDSNHIYSIKNKLNYTQTFIIFYYKPFTIYDTFMDKMLYFVQMLYQFLKLIHQQEYLQVKEIDEKNNCNQL